MSPSLKEPLVYSPLLIAIGFVAGALSMMDTAQAQDPCPVCPPCICLELEPCMDFDVEMAIDEEEAVQAALEAIHAVEKFEPIIGPVIYKPDEEPVLVPAQPTP